MSDWGTRELTDEDAKLFIGNLSYHTREERLTEAFEKYGTIKECRVALEPGTERSRGYAFVTMEDPVDAAMCVKNISGQDVDGRLIKVEVATGVRGSGSARRGRGDRYGDGGDRDRDSIRENRDNSRDKEGGRDRGRERDRDHRRERNLKGVIQGDRESGGTVAGSGGRERSRDRGTGRDSNQDKESQPFIRDRSRSKQI